jgi:hypothetical protein
MESSASWKIACCLCLLIFPVKSDAVSCVLNDKLIESGDLIYRYQDSFISNLVLKYQGEASYSHVGIAIKENGQIKVLHALLEPDKKIDGVTSSTYCDYVHDSVRIEVKRLRKSSLDVTNQLQKNIKLIGNKKFNRTFGLDTKDSVYCTQFIWLLFKDIKPADPFEVDLKSNKIITVKKLLDSNYFFTVFNQSI